MNSEAELGPQVAARLGYLLKRGFLELEALHAEHLAPYDLNARELTVLLLLDGRAPESQQQTAQRLGVDRTTMVGLLDGLEGKGLVARQSDPDDRRRNVVVLTPTGRRTLTAATAASDDAERQLLSPLSSTEAKQLRALLARLETRPRLP